MNIFKSFSIEELQQIHLTFHMSSYEENRNFEVTLRFAFFLLREVLVYAVKKLLKFKMYKIIFVASSVLEIISQKKTLCPQYSYNFGSVYNSTRVLPSSGRNK